MEKRYEIKLNMRVIGGMTEFGSYQIATDIDVAKALFANLEGKKETSSTPLLRLDLVEILQDENLILASINCTLDELERNCRFITREAFKIFNLEG